MDSYTRFRLQRQLRRWGRELGAVPAAISRFWNQHLGGKWHQLTMVRGFVAAWWLLIIILLVGTAIQVNGVSSKGMVARRLPGGTYSEALVGTVKSINPILPENSASSDVSRLVFSGLTRYNDNGGLEPNLAKSWTVSPDGKTYTFELKSGIKWHDGVPFTSKDVEFTLAAIQNPDTRSPLADSWQNVKVSTPNDQTVVYTLPKPFAPFLNDTTVGVLPRHLLEGVDPSQMRVAEFNQKPVGTGPFKLSSFDVQNGEITLDQNRDYFNGKPLLDSVKFKTYISGDAALDAYVHKQVNGVARLQPAQTAAAKNAGDLKQYEMSVPDEVAVFFKNSNAPWNDKTVRTAMAQATDREAIARQAGQAVALNSPLLPGQVNLAGIPRQPAYNPSAAAAALDAAGWKKGSDGVRAKGNTKLHLTLVTQQDSPYSPLAETLKAQWEKIGVKAVIKQVGAIDLQQSYIRPRHYDALLYGINVGADPDVYNFWHSSQATDPGLNLSVYKNPLVDKALEAGRTVLDPKLRSAKYRSFVQLWVADNPAVMLYTPEYVYGVDSKVLGVSTQRLISPSDRFYDIEHWAVRSQMVPR
jgi:peptide/nickel transport system substrate-binding protein